MVRLIKVLDNRGGESREIWSHEYDKMSDMLEAIEVLEKPSIFGVPGINIVITTK